jgi:hypothetical protein
MNAKTLGKRIPFSEAVHYLLEKYDKSFDWLARRVGLNPLLMYCQLHRDKLSFEHMEEVVKIMGDLAIARVREGTKQP